MIPKRQKTTPAQSGSLESREGSLGFSGLKKAEREPFLSPLKRMTLYRERESQLEKEGLN